MISSQLYVNRMMVQTLIQLANNYQGGTWALTGLLEGERQTVLDFETEHPVRDPSQRQVRRVQITVTAIDEELSGDEPTQ
jgi:hypothetical protein